MGLADSLADIPPKYSSIRCKLRTWAESLEPDDQAALWAAIYTDNKPTRDIARLVTRNGHQVSTATIQNHRSGNCGTCERVRDGAG